MSIPIIVIEEYDKEGDVEWGISFTNPNPEAKDYFKMPDSETAFRLKDYLTVNAPFSFNNPIGSPTDKL